MPRDKGYYPVGKKAKSGKKISIGKKAKSALMKGYTAK